MGSILEAGRGCKSKSSLGGANLLGRMMFLKDSGRILSEQIQRSEITLI
jgi:hypothetical protein